MSLILYYSGRFLFSCVENLVECDFFLARVLVKLATLIFFFYQHRHSRSD